jgi:phosphatidylglycerol:prolipoprotein diacylglycerol transferase
MAVPHESLLLYGTGAMHPILFEIGNFFVGTYGLFVALGLLTGVWISCWRARRNGVDDNLILDLAFVGFVAGMLGARLTYILVEWEGVAAAFRHPDRSVWREYILIRQGFVYAGGMILAVGAAVWLIRRRGASLWRVADCIAPAIPLGHGLGRVGCFFAGCCWGSPCELPWAVSFPKVIGPRGEVLGMTHQYHLYEGWISADATHSLPVHPIQLYEALALFGLFLILTWLWRRRRFEGQVFLAYLLIYPVARFGLEYFRGDPERGIYFGLSSSQHISIVVLVLGLVFWVKRRGLPLPQEEERKPESEGGGQKRKRGGRRKK